MDDIRNILNTQPLSTWIISVFLGLVHLVRVLFFGSPGAPVSTFFDEFLNVENSLASLVCVASVALLLARLDLGRLLAMLALSMYIADAVTLMLVPNPVVISIPFLRASATLALILLGVALFSRELPRRC